MSRIVVVENSKLKRGGVAWLKWIWNNNGHLGAGDKIVALCAVIPYHKLINMLLKYDLKA